VKKGAVAQRFGSKATFGMKNDRINKIDADLEFSFVLPDT
jgi:hypothetical protein